MGKMEKSLKLSSQQSPTCGKDCFTYEHATTYANRTKLTNAKAIVEITSNNITVTSLEMM